MSDPYVVIVTIDHAPHDSDIENEVLAYAFQGPIMAERFFKVAVGFAEDTTEKSIVVFEPISIAQFPLAADGFADLVHRTED